ESLVKVVWTRVRNSLLAGAVRAKRDARLGYSKTEFDVARDCFRSCNPQVVGRHGRLAISGEPTLSCRRARDAQERDRALEQSDPRQQHSRRVVASIRCGPAARLGIYGPSG